MRFLSVNHLRLGSSPGGIPAHVAPDTRGFSTRNAWQRAISLAIREHVHAVVLTGETLSTANDGLEPWGPLVDGLTELQQATIPVIAREHGEFNARNLTRFAPDGSVLWLTDSLDWQPVFTTDTAPIDEPSVHVIAGSLAEHADSPANNPVTLEQMDQASSIWLLTESLQPDQVSAANALVIEPGSAAPLTARETGRHGAWVVETETREATLYPLASIEFASIDIDISAADDLDSLDRIIASALVNLADSARKDGSIAETLLAELTLTGSSRLYPSLADIADELQRMLLIEHDGMTIAIHHIANDATPVIDLQPLLNRPDPVGEVARLISALDSGTELTDAQARLVTATEQKLLAISHARVFGSILDLEPDIDATTLLRRQGWATLDALVRQRGID